LNLLKKTLDYMERVYIYEKIRGNGFI